MEDEHHVLFNCDLYAKLRAYVIGALNNSPEIEGMQKLNINLSSLMTNLMQLLSPNATHELTPNTIDQFNQHHTNLNIEPNTPAHKSLLETRSHIINSVCRYINRCLDKRWKYLEEFRKKDTRNLKTIIISIKH